MDTTVKKSMWNNAGTAGLIMGLISTASMFIGQFLSTKGLSPVMTGISGFAVWVAETGGCIYMMYFFMKKFSSENPSADNAATFRMGMVTALLSALVYSGATFANMGYISADYYTEQYQLMFQQMNSILDSNSRAMLETMIDKMPQIAFFSNLIYCYLFGTIVSAALSRGIPAKDPFADYKPDEQ
ncbi:MAG: DUF4199 domain-containing protein [Bacteroidales bacterium]|nr:DUF4199 domain-containing protein [Bacteroidales bacterium]